MSETRKKVIKILVILVTGITVLTIAGLIFFPLLWNSFIAYLEKKFEPPVCEVEEWEKELLIEEYPNSEETIREGKLYENHLALLNEIRTGMAYLEEKYPGYKFSINYRDDWAVTIIDYRVTEETTGERFKLRFYTDEERRHQPEDDFYKYFIETDYNKYLEEQLRQQDEKIVKTKTWMIYPEGREYGLDMTMNDFITGKLELTPSVNIYVSAKDMTEEGCDQYVNKVKREIEQINLTGTYVIKFWDMEKEEMENRDTDEYENFICRYVVHWHYEED